MIESLEDNVNLVVARETMRQAEDARQRLFIRYLPWIIQITEHCCAEKS